MELFWVLVGQNSEAVAAAKVVPSWDWEPAAFKWMSIKVPTMQTNLCITLISGMKENQDPNGVQNNKKAGPLYKMTPPRPDIAEAVYIVPNKDESDSTKVKPDIGE